MDGRTTRILVWIAIGVSLVMDPIYLGAISLQGAFPPDRYTVGFVAGYVLLMSAMLAGSTLPRPNRALRAGLRAGAAAGLIVLGVLAAFSVGLPLLLAGAVAMVAAARTVGSRWKAPSLFGAASAAVAVAVLIAGFEVTERMISCPAHGYMGGSGTGFVTGPYHYECVNGRLDWRPGLCTHGGASFDAGGNVIATGGC